MTVLSIGHSNQTAALFLSQIEDARLDAIIDVRSHPTSKWLWFTRDLLASYLPRAEVAYEWLPELGGWTERHLEWTEAMRPHGVDVAAYAGGMFPKHRIAGKRLAEPGPAWTNQGLYDYAWYTTLPDFRGGIGNLLTMEEQFGRVAIMCAEALWWRCHRSMIADYLLDVKSVDVEHIIGGRITKHSKSIGNRLDRYPSEVRTAWHK